MAHGLESIMHKSEMRISRKARMLPNSKSTQVLSLDPFKQPGSPIIDSVQYSCPRSQKLQPTSHKRICFATNSLILLVTKTYIYDKITSGNVERLLSEFETNIDTKLLVSLPQQFQLHYQPETVQSVLRLGCLRLAQFKDDIEAQAQLTRLINNYPFFRVCMILWARCKSAQYLQTFRAEFDLLLGNQRGTILDYSRELRFIALDILCRSFETKLVLEHVEALQLFGDAQSQSEVRAKIPQDQSGMVLVEDTTIKDTETSYSQTDNGEGYTKQLRSSPSAQVISPLSPKSIMQLKECQKCGCAKGSCRCNTESLLHKLPKRGLFEHYISVLKTCKQCGGKEIIYKGVCRKCQSKKH